MSSDGSRRSTRRRAQRLRDGVFYGREGEIIEGQYRILKIGVESLDIAYLDGRGPSDHQTNRTINAR